MTEAMTVRTLVADALGDAPPEPPERTGILIRIPRPRQAPTTAETTSRRRHTARLPWVRTGAELVAIATAATTVVALTAMPVLDAAVATLVWILFLAASGHLRRTALGGSRTAASARIGRTGAIALLVAVASTPLRPGATAPVDLAVLATALVLASLVVAVLAGRRRARLVLVGHPRDVRDALVELRTVDRDDVVALCLTRRTRAPFVDVPTYVGLDRVAPALLDQSADAAVVLPGRHSAPAAMRRLQWDVAEAGGEVYLGTGLLDVAPQRRRLTSVAGLDVLHVAPAALSGPRRRTKDLVERIAALVALTLCLPLLAVLCVLIRRGSPGPALFRQERVGRGGVPFTMLKLRTMSENAEDERSGLTVANEKDGVLFKIALDPRITPLGRVLRRYSLDELPQLWNVVRGDMSLVGPRPALPGEVAAYDRDPRRRLAVKPGLTGLWQVSGRSNLTWSESVRLDLKYVDNWSLRLDLAILMRTVHAVVGHRGAY